jgi:hypothetical protein
LLHAEAKLTGIENALDYSSPKFDSPCPEEQSLIVSLEVDAFESAAGSAI